MANSFNIFSKIAAVRPAYSRFSLSHEKKMTFNAGKVIPLVWFEGVPGDKFKISANMFVRTQTLIAPMMHREDFRVRFYKIPVRQLVNPEDLEKAFTGGEDGQHIDFPMIAPRSAGMTVGSLYDYLDLPLPYHLSSGSWVFDGGSLGADGVVPKISPLPFLAYHKIYNDWLRNEEVENEVSHESNRISFGSRFSVLNAATSLNTATLKDTSNNALYPLDFLHNIGWERDYFTSALKNSQRGNEISIPLVGNAPVSSILDSAIPGHTSVQNPLIANTGADPSKNVVLGYTDAQTHIFNKVNMFADLSVTSGIGAIALRTYMNLQAFRERANVAGYRLKEWIYAFFGVHTKDSTLDYAAYLGGASFPVSVTQVTQMSATEDGSTPQGNLSGNGTVIGSMKPIIVHCDEPCIIMALGWIIPKSGYSQGLERRWTRKDWTEYYNPFFESIGEQEIKNQELLYQWNGNYGDSSTNEDTWAYQSRYSEYKYIPDRVNGDFRTSLSYWHKSRLFGTLPAFNADFVKCQPTDRVFALADNVTEMHYLADIYWDIKALRPMHKYATSKLW